jgi:hypothetical protein
LYRYGAVCLELYKVFNGAAIEAGTPYKFANPA